VKVIHVVSISSGKDSTAIMLLAIEKHGKEACRFVFADTGNEHEEVDIYLEYLEKRLGVHVDRLKANFDRQIANKRMFIARDRRTGRRNGKKIRWSNKSKRRALGVLHPTGNGYLDLCLWKGRFPSRRAQFCTQYLKTEILVRYAHALIDEGYTVVSWQGVRRDESPARRDVLQIEEAGEQFWQYRPIADWTAAEVIEYQLSKGITPNPLYRQGMKRMGCMPCINAGKAEITEIAKRFPGHIERIAEWEKLVALASKHNGATFFPNLDRDPIDKPDIFAVVN
jgi:3'-phosphoadenosine 5'-phosphosulfate sulfotransferase (PAPS reductase)/FAD synthetase